MNRIYLDNAATTSIDPEVVDAMMPYLTQKFGNPSSIYSYGREAKMAIESSRKQVAKLLNAHPGEIFFTSGGTESSNTAINAAINDLHCKHIITSPIEHHATLHTVEHLAKSHGIQLSFVSLDALGHVDIDSLKNLLENSTEKCLVTLMHANNEIGNILDIQKVGQLCNEYNAVFHCDTVQTVGHYPIDLKGTPVHFVTGAGHKFHGPKGVGILYVSEDITIHPYLTGGAQERNMRAGTENVYGIVGFAKALELAMNGYEKDAAYIQSLKTYMIEELSKALPELCFNGDHLGSSLYTVLNIGIPKTEKTEMILFNLDMDGICVSGGSACSSGANASSHVINAVQCNKNIVPIRFSFSKHTTKEDIDTAIQKLISHL